MKRIGLECFKRDPVIIELDRIGHDKFVFYKEWLNEEKICDQYYEFLKGLDEKTCNKYLKAVLPKEEWQYPYVFAHEAYRFERARQLWKVGKIDKKGKLVFEERMPEGFSEDQKELPHIDDENCI